MGTVRAAEVGAGCPSLKLPTHPTALSCIQATVFGDTTGEGQAATTTFVLLNRCEHVVSVTLQASPTGMHGDDCLAALTTICDNQAPAEACSTSG